MQYDNTNTGAIFKNDKKETDKHPDYKGSANVDGIEYWVSAWLKTSKSGEKFMSFSYTPKDKASGNSSGKKEKPTSNSKEDFESDIPF
jgi:hypothetical protein